MRLYPDSKVYIFCPSNYASGGPELCHQLCSQLIAFNVDAYMFYSIKAADPVNNFYKKYHLPYTFEPEDSEKNFFIVPEYFIECLYRVKNIRRIFWWMSVDNYLKSLSALITNHIPRALLNSVPKVFYLGKGDEDIIHFVQSEYARQFLLVNGVPEYKIYMVEDYLNQAFLSRAAQIDLNRKENIVVYNPKKGFEVTKQFIEFAPEIDWRPIQNMTPDKVQELLAKAKIYIDFGEHPGKDRIPREAAISGCVVITGRRGSAGNDVDINIPAEFKFDERTTTLQQVIEKIREVFKNFETAYQKQADYRAKILDDKNRFENEVAEAFGINKSYVGAAPIQSVAVENFLLVEKIFQDSNRMPSFIIDDILALTKISDEILFREQNRNYLRVNDKLIEIITRADAKFLYQEGRIKKFALLAPSETELADFKNFYEPANEDILIFER